MKISIKELNFDYYVLNSMKYDNELCEGEGYKCRTTDVRLCF